MLLCAGTVNDTTASVLTFPIEGLRQVEVENVLLNLRAPCTVTKDVRSKFVIRLLFQCISAGEDVMSGYRKCILRRLIIYALH